jgi:hypothetical protein
MSGEQAAESVLHRAGGGGVDVAFDRRQMDDVFAEKIVGQVDAPGIDAVQDVHLRLGFIANPLHILRDEIETNRDVVLFKNRSNLLSFSPCLGRVTTVCSPRPQYQKNRI